jgi:N-acetyltransferase 10
MKKKIDDKIKILIENCLASYERSMFIIVGDRGRDQVNKINNFYKKLFLFNKLKNFLQINKTNF